MNIDSEVLKLKEQIFKDKEFFWNHPETQFEEFETSKYIEKRLKEIGYKDIKTGIAKTGVMAELEGTSLGECILFRADMDALLMDNTGKKQHACGHDAHMAIMLGLAQILMNNKDKIKGRVKIVFQPAEEGDGGAKKMIEEGILENPKVDRVFGIHVWSELETGKIGIKPGPIMASTDPIELNIIGKGGHGALPEKCINPIYIANDLIFEIQKIQKEFSKEDNVVFGVTAVNAGTSNNIIPEMLNLKGICRTYDPKIREYLKEKLKEICLNAEEKWKAKIEFLPVFDRPAVINSEKESEDIKQIAEEIVGKENVVSDYQTMCSEDFSFFLERKAGAFIFVGDKLDVYYPQHSINYRVSEDGVIIGMSVLEKIAKKYLF